MYPTYTRQGLTGIIGAAGARQLLNGLNEQFNLQAYGATGLGGEDDTIAVQLWTAALNTYGDGAVGVVPKGVYLVHDATNVVGAANSASSGPVNITADGVTIIGYGGIFKVNTNGVDTSVVRVFGDRCNVIGVQVDCNALVANTLKSNSGIELNGCSDSLVENCTVFNGLKSTDTSQLTQGEDSYVITGCTRAVIRGSRSYDSGWTGIKIGNSSGTLVDGCWVVGQRGHGIRCQGAMETIHIINTRCYSTICSGRSNIIIDPASSGSTARCQKAWISNCQCVCNPRQDYGGGSGNCLKIASTVECWVDNSSFDSDDNFGAVCIRLEDCVRKITFTKCYFKGEFSYAPNSGDIWYGTLSNANTDSGGFATLTLPTTAVGVGKSIFVKGSGVTQYNREHIITAKPTTSTYTTNVPYVAGTVGTTAYGHTMIDESRFIDCTFESELSTGGTYNITNMFGRIMDFERCRFLNYTPATSKMGAIDYNTPDTHLELLRFKDVEVIFNSSNICKAVRPNTLGTTEVQTLLFTQAITSGTFTLTHAGNTTGSITFSTNTTTLASNIQTALRALTGYSLVTVAYTSGAFGSADVLFTVTMLGQYGDIAQMTSNVGGLSGGTPGITHATTVPGVASGMLMESGKTIGLRFNVTNLGGGLGLKADTNTSGDTASPYPNRTTIFTSRTDRVSDYMIAAAPTVGDISWLVGDQFTNSAPSAGARPGWVQTTAGRNGAGGVTQQMAALS